MTTSFFSTAPSVQGRIGPSKAFGNGNRPPISIRQSFDLDFGFPIVKAECIWPQAMNMKTPLVPGDWMSDPTKINSFATPRSEPASRDLGKRLPVPVVFWSAPTRHDRKPQKAPWFLI